VVHVHSTDASQP